MMPYENEVKKYLRANDADTKLAAFQQKIINTLQKAPEGKLPRDTGRKNLYAQVGGVKYDTDFWERAYKGLERNYFIEETEENGITWTQLLKVPDYGDDDE